MEDIRQDIQTRRGALAQIPLGHLFIVILVLVGIVPAGRVIPSRTGHVIRVVETMRFRLVKARTNVFLLVRFELIFLILQQNQIKSTNQ